MDKRIIKTRYALTHALFDLLEDHSIDKITVTQLCRCAGVDRRTFYTHYSGIADIFEDYQNQLSNQVYSAFTSARNTDAEKLLRIFHQILMDNYTGFKHLCLNEQHHILVAKLQQMLYETLCDILLVQSQDTADKVVLQYLSSGLIDSYVFWFSHQDEIEYNVLVATNTRIAQTNLALVDHAVRKHAMSRR